MLVVLGAHAIQNGLSHKKSLPQQPKQQQHSPARHSNGKHSRKSLLEKSEERPNQQPMSLAVLDGDYVVYPQKQPAHYSMKASVTASGEYVDGSKVSNHNTHSDIRDSSVSMHVSLEASSQSSTPIGKIGPRRRHQKRVGWVHRPCSQERVVDCYAHFVALLLISCLYRHVVVGAEGYGLIGEAGGLRAPSDNIIATAA